MKTYGHRMARVTAPVIGALALLSTGMVTVPVEAQAATLGRVCMFEAPRGAYGAGHAAFAIRDRSDTRRWIYGSFGSTNDAPKAGWIKGGSWENVRQHFISVRDKDHDNARYYTRYRCVNTRDGDLNRARSWYTTVKNRGYNVSTNNCLHMSMAVFKGYSETLRRDTRLKSATNWTPNNYYRDVLPAAHWEVSHSL